MTNPTALHQRAPEIEGIFGVVAVRPIGSRPQFGMSMLERGGKRLSMRRWATAFHVCRWSSRNLNGPGGDVPVILYDAARGENPIVICGQGCGAA